MLTSLAENWFNEGDDETPWHEFDDVHHSQGALLNDPLHLSLTREGGEEEDLGALLGLINEGKVPHNAQYLNQPSPRDDGVISCIACEKFKGFLEYDLPEIIDFDLCKLTLQITRFVGMCDLTEDDVDVWEVTGVCYDGAALEVTDCSGRGKGGLVALGFIRPDEDEEKVENVTIPEKNWAQRLYRNVYPPGLSSADSGSTGGRGT
jgi:hypothetical protein